MCGALATRLPSWLNTAQEKSRRSLMLTEWAVLASVAPICSAMDMNRLLNTSSITGSTSGADRHARGPRHDPPEDQVVAGGELGAPAGFDHRGGVGLVDDRRAVDGVARRAVPRGRRPASRARRRRSGFARESAAASGGAPSTRGRSGSMAVSVTPTASTEMASTTRRRSAMVKPKRCRWSVLEGGGHVRRAAEGDQQRRVGALVAQVRLAENVDRLAPPRPGPRPRRGPRRRARPAASPSSPSVSSASGASTACSRSARMSARPMP